MWNLAELVLALTLASGPEPCLACSVQRLVPPQPAASSPSLPASTTDGSTGPRKSASQGSQQGAPSAGSFLGLSPGDQIRFATAGEQPTTVWSVVAADPDTLLLRLPGAAESVRIPWSSLKKLEVHRGQRSKADKGAKIGALALGIPGALLGIAAAGLREIDCWSDCRSDSGYWLFGLAGGAAGATVGVLTGALIGSAFKTDRWDKVGLPPIQVSLTPQRRGGMAVALSLRF